MRRLIFLCLLGAIGHPSWAEDSERVKALGYFKQALDAAESETRPSEALPLIDKALDLKFSDAGLRSDLRELKKRVAARLDRTYRPYLDQAEAHLKAGELYQARDLCLALAEQVPSYPSAQDCLYRVKQAFYRKVVAGSP